MNASGDGFNQGKVTERQDLTDEGEIFMQQSDAEIGRQSSKQDRSAT